jgi:hypothetical protein
LSIAMQHGSNLPRIIAKCSIRVNEFHMLLTIDCKKRLCPLVD